MTVVAAKDVAPIGELLEPSHMVSVILLPWM